MRKPIYMIQRDLEAARREAEQVFLNALIEGAFQRGVERGKFDQRMEMNSDNPVTSIALPNEQLP